MARTSTRRINAILKQKKKIDELLEKSIRETVFDIFYNRKKGIRPVNDNLSVVIRDNKEQVRDIIPESLMFVRNTNQLLVVDVNNVFGKDINEFDLLEQVQILDILKKELNIR